MKQLYILDAWERLKHAPLERAVQLAAFLCDHVRVNEEPKGSNRGYWVEAFLEACGLGGGNPWCAAFVTFVLKTCGIMPDVDGPAAVRNWAAWAEKNGKLTTAPKRGDLFFTLNANGTGHIGFVIEAKNGQIRTIEGNTNDEGDREGFEVCRRQRPMAGLKFIRVA